MHVRVSAGAVEVTTPAKLNLFLEVLGRREDGYHELETLMVPISRYDTLCFTPSYDERLTLTCDDSPLRLAIRAAGGPSPTQSGCEQLPSGDENLVIRAIKRLREASGFESGGTLRLTKRIPLAAGLAGGSSDAAAALVAANVAWQLGWSRERLAIIGSEIGSDVPFFLTRGPAICRGRGERIERLDAMGAWHFVVVKPNVGLSTAAVFKACKASSQPQSVQPLVAALRQGKLRLAGTKFHNSLQAVASSLSPWIERLTEEFSRLSLLGHQMSGSGTSYFGLCANATQARRVAQHVRSRGLGQAWPVMSCA